ncbi:protein FAM151B isoform X2 [Hypanus sabinus]|uniref:protein FAM151B isoform X2 n=1 Tax=Hypanus sabinus TaxID=79690 RepID=UPI0028C38959|nr:protein FAM151B isoform X2 [Hypanus sabinus]
METDAGGGEDAVEYFFKKRRIHSKDALEIIWYHAANRKARMKEALNSDAHMIEADVVFGSQGPIMAHPPETDSDNTLQNWLNEVLQSDKGIKLDFKSLSAVEPAMKTLLSMKHCLARPVWINADVLPGPGGNSSERIASNHGYTWEMVKEMEEVCRALCQPVTFPVRAALVAPSWPQLHWLLQQSERYSLTVWTAREDSYSLQDMSSIREDFDKSRIYYDLFEPQMSELRHAVKKKIKDHV